MNGWERAALWAFGLPLVAVPAFWTGEDRYQCEGGECDLTALNGLGWAIVASLIYLLVLCAIELTLLHFRNRQEAELERIRNGEPPR